MIKDKVALNAILVCIQGVTRTLVSSYSTAILINIICTLLSLILILLELKELSNIKFNGKKYLIYYLVYAVAILFYSFFVANSYEEWRYVFTEYFPSLLLPYYAIACTTPNKVVKLFRVMLIVATPLSALLYFSDVTGMMDYAHYSSFIYVFLLFMPYMSVKWRLFFLLLALNTILFNIDFRGNIMSISVILLVFILYFFVRKNWFMFFIKKGFQFFMYAPIVFALLGVSEIFNIFNFGENFRDDFVLNYSEKVTSISQDTRTGVYTDALKAISESRAYLWGLSAAGRHQTELKNVNDDFYEILINGRMGSEVGILEYLLRGGGIFIMLVLLIYYKSAYLGIWKSNNLLCKILGLFIAYRWFFLFIEAQPSLNLSNVSIFATIGICFSPIIRKMNDKEIGLFIKKIFKVYE